MSTHLNCNPDIEIFESYENRDKRFCPNSSIFCYTLPSKNYPIPDNYSVKTTWRHKKVYKQFNLLKIKFHLQAVNSSNKSVLSGPLLFGLQLQTLKKVREPWDKRIVKPTEQCSEQTFKRHTKNIRTIIKEKFI
ncbi:15658_t:CDS:2 [Dentiscutata erythropus]|uniref:15658_t:CDS:1 n=1 Tax=Dentiscutata erythropus TaxID=1348616 RepID=A0A9N8VG39_9GLOM|nr:15658_t:CDS:2 [Dentiscutata erythropus]